VNCRDPETRGNDADVLAKSLDEANAVARRLAALPEVARTRTLSSFIPDDQDEKISAIKLAARSLGRALNPAHQQSAPSDQDTVDAIRKTATQRLDRRGHRRHWRAATQLLRQQARIDQA
jgi:hypothetical protein